MKPEKIDMEYFCSIGYLKYVDKEQTYYHTQEWSKFIKECFSRNTVVTEDRIYIKIVTPEDLQFVLNKNNKKKIDDGNKCK